MTKGFLKLTNYQRPDIQNYCADAVCINATNITDQTSKVLTQTQDVKQRRPVTLSAPRQF
jgi:hypothetical protein